MSSSPLRSDGSPPPVATAWHAFDAETVLQAFESDRVAGLKGNAVAERLDRYGPNELDESGGRGAWEILLDQFGDVMLLMLIGVALVSAGLDVAQGLESGTFPFPKDTVAILTIVLLNAVLGYVQESRAEKALASLKRLSSPRVRVVRDGILSEIDAKQLVPGDVMLLEAGMQVAADGRLLEASGLQLRESALTGEANPVGKRAQLVLEADAALGDRRNAVFQGTEVVQGRGQAVVTATGMRTELGKIAAMLQTVEMEPTPLQRRMNQLGQVLVSGSLILVALVVGGGTLAAGWGAFRNLLEVSLSMAVAVVPEGLPAVITVTLALGTQRMVRRHALIRKLPAVETLGSVTTICSDKTGTLTQNKMVVQVVELGDCCAGSPNACQVRVSGEGYEPIGEFVCTREDWWRDRSGTEKTPPGDASGETPEADPPKLLHAKTLPQAMPDLHLLLVAGLLCNDAALQQDAEVESGPGQSPWSVLGDPTEGALLSLAGKANIVQEVWARQFPRAAEVPFTSERKRMSVVVAADRRKARDARAFPLLPCDLSVGEFPGAGNSPGNRASNTAAKIAGKTAENGADRAAPPYLLFAKGSPELVLQACDRLQLRDRAVVLDEATRSTILARNDVLAGRGLRVLGLAYRTLDVLPDDPTAARGDDLERDLTWLGLVGMLDAPRPEARQAVAQSRAAGIRPVMITGDHRLTAQAIAEELGIARPGDRALLGKHLETMSQAELEEAVARVSVYARVSPEHKLRIVRALQNQNHIVAMTGDGVNDAPALKQANIGIAMGITGTDASKEASDMVLLDDNFASIVAATEEGRVVYDNIRRFIKYILGSNIGEVLTVASAPILLPMGGVPMTPLQILWMNLVTDGLPALALAMEPATPDVMRRPPHPPQESIFARGLGSYMIRIGLVFAAFTIVLMTWAYHYAEGTSHPDSWKTMVFTTLCVAQMGHALAVRSQDKLIVEMDLGSNPYVLWSVTLTTVLQFLLVYVPPLQSFFGTVPLDRVELLVCLGFSSLVLVWIELEKLFVRWVWRRR